MSVVDDEVFTVEKYRNHASVSKGNTPRVYLMRCDKVESDQEETSNLIPSPPVNETPASTSSNVALDQSAECKEMLENFVHDALTEIGYDNANDELLMFVPFNDLPTINSQLDDDDERNTGSGHASPTRSSKERRALIEEENKEYNEALKEDQRKEHEKEKELEHAKEMEQLRLQRQA